MKHDFLVCPPHLNQAFESGGSSGGAWGNGITRRSFIKRTGGATVASLVAWNLSSGRTNAATTVGTDGSFCGSGSASYRMKLSSVIPEDAEPFDVVPFTVTISGQERDAQISIEVIGGEPLEGFQDQMIMCSYVYGIYARVGLRNNNGVMQQIAVLNETVHASVGLYGIHSPALWGTASTMGAALDGSSGPVGNSDGQEGVPDLPEWDGEEITIVETSGILPVRDSLKITIGGVDYTFSFEPSCASGAGWTSASGSARIIGGNIDASTDTKDVQHVFETYEID